MLDRCFLCCHIQLTKGKVSFVDPETWVTIRRTNWRAKLSQGGWYAIKISSYNGKKQYTYMHRLIAKTPKGMVCHHRNGNGLDNRLSNLENMTQAYHKNITKMLRIAKTHATN